MNVIEVKSLEKSYGDIKAVKGISFEVREGSLFAFLGPNGAGKSTTIDVLCTLNQFDKGEISVAGFDLKTESKQIRQNIGVVFQDNLLDKALTIKENLTIRAGFYFKKREEILEAVKTAAKEAKVEDLMKRKYGTLSGGQRRRADIARALLNSPKILFLDEPTTGLDPQTRKHVWETITRLQREKSMTIFLTTHYMEEAAAADYVVIIDEGKTVAHGSPYELKEAYSHEHIKIKAKKDCVESIIKYLDGKKLKYKNKKSFIDIKISSTLYALDILEPIREYLESFEVLHGTMDDVFLNITGKEIRE